MPLSNLWPFLVPLGLVALAGGSLLATWAVGCLRDRVWPPAEKQYGCGLKRVLLIFQPSLRRGGARVAQLTAQALVRAGHAVTVNRPSETLSYDPEYYDLLVFGGSTYMGEVGKPLRRYLSSMRFCGKQVLLYTLGDSENAPELATLRLCVPAGNTVRSLKLSASEHRKLAEFATASPI